jgi:hypothetical protein
MYLRLTGGTSEVTKVLKKYKVEIQDSTGKMRPMMDILDEVGKKTKDLDDKTRQAAFTHLFGARAVNSATLLMKAGGEQVGEYQKSLEAAEGTARKLADTIGKSVDNRLKAMKSRMVEVGLSVIDNFRDKIPAALDSMQQSLDAIDPTEIVSDINNIIETLKNWSIAIEAVAAAWVVYKGAVLAAAAKQAILNAMMAANPVGLFILWLSALGAIIWTVYRNWDTLVGFFSTTMSKIGTWIEENIIMRIESLLNMIPQVTKFLGIVTRSDEVMAQERARNRQAAAEDQTGVTRGNREVADILSRHSGGVDPNLAAPTPSIQFEGQLNFNNPPEGMSFEQETRGAPPIQHNLGQN